MAHERKKNGERKDKKNERMRESVQVRHENPAEPHSSTDQPDVQTFKPGAASDRNTRPETKTR
jgi:hypothetical protein